MSKNDKIHLLLCYPAVQEKSVIDATPIKVCKVGCLTKTYSQGFDGFGTRPHILEYEEC